MIFPDISSAGASHAESQPASDSAERAFSLSMLLSGLRCLLAYVVFPWALPAMSAIGRVGSALGLAIGTVAVAFNVLSIRRFWLGGHRYKWIIVVINSGVIALLTVLMAADIADLI